MAKSNAMTDKSNMTVGRRQRVVANNCRSNPTTVNPTHPRQYESRVTNPTQRQRVGANDSDSNSPTITRARPRCVGTTARMNMGSTRPGVGSIRFNDTRSTMRRRVQCGIHECSVKGWRKRGRKRVEKKVTWTGLIPQTPPRPCGSTPHIFSFHFIQSHSTSLHTTQGVPLLGYNIYVPIYKPREV